MCAAVLCVCGRNRKGSRLLRILQLKPPSLLKPLLSQQALELHLYLEKLSVRLELAMKLLNQ